MFKNKNPLNYTETVKDASGNEMKDASGNPITKTQFRPFMGIRDRFSGIKQNVKNTYSNIKPPISLYDASGNVKKYKLDLPSLVKNIQPNVNPGAKAQVIDANRIDDTIVDTKTENNNALYKLLYETPEEQRQSINTDKIMVAANQDVNNAQNQIRNLKIAVTRTNPPDANTLQSLKEQEQKLKNAENKLKELSNIYKNNPNDFVNRVYEYNYNKATSPGLTGLKNITRSLNPMNMMSSRASSSASNSVTQKNNVRSTGKGKKITITFIQDDRNQCFIKDYNLCSVDNVSTELSNVYDDKLIIDGNNKPVKKNIQNIGKNQQVTYGCDYGASQLDVISTGGYDASKSIRKINRPRKSVKSAKTAKSAMYKRLRNRYTRRSL
jgi:hypothetical protein